MPAQPIAAVENLIPPERQAPPGVDLEAAREVLLAADPRRLLEFSGSFALVARDGIRVTLARSLDRPLRYFLAKREEGPQLVVAERIDEIAAWLAERGWGDQFHPSYTRMVPAHHVTTLRLVGCPDPEPTFRRFLEPEPGALPADLDEIGRRYVGAMLDEVTGWLAAQDASEPIGVLFSGGIDSGSVLLAVHELLRRQGKSPARLKAFTLAVDSGGDDAGRAREFLARTGLEMLGETVEVASEALDVERAIAVLEDYKPRDVECATVALALVEAIRARYPEWRLLVDGDGGDENLKDYPIEENPELTIVSVVNNPLLYQEGWGVGTIKHSLTYSGGLSRGCARTYAPLAATGFAGFSPYTRPAVVQVAASIPFAELAAGSHERLYGLKGEIVRRGIAHHLGIEMPVFDKARFQEGATGRELFAAVFAGEAAYRRTFEGLYRSA